MPAWTRSKQADHEPAARPAPRVCKDECVVTDFNTVGDGPADDRDALQSAIDATRSQNKTLRLPAGTYRTTAYLDCRGAYGNRVGASRPCWSSMN